MKDTRIDFEAGLKGLDLDDWIAQLDHVAEELGYCEPLGTDHLSSFIDAGPNLLVTFENAKAIRSISPEAEPRGFAFVRSHGWSHLAIISREESWYRDPAIYGYFDRLVDDGFFEDFDNVVFHGANGAGYAAAAYSVAAPGCTVLAIGAQATLDPDIAGFDRRHIAQRRHNFSSRYGYAPDMVNASRQTYVAFDPYNAMDAVHAALFTADNVTPLRCYCLGNNLDRSFDEIGIHDALITAAMDDALTCAYFRRLIRARREASRYQRGLFQQMMRRDHPILAANVATYALRNRSDPFFRQKLEELADQGHRPTIPAAIQAAE